MGCTGFCFLFHELTDKKEKYKAIQWAIYLPKVSGLVSKDLIQEIQDHHLDNILWSDNEKARR